jgi:cell wall-associated NlpC family hydrolase
MLIFSRDGTAAGVHHVGLYLGEGRMVHAPRTGKTVEVVEVWSSAYWSREFIGAVRAVPAAAPVPADPLPAAA